MQHIIVLRIYENACVNKCHSGTTYHKGSDLKPILNEQHNLTEEDFHFIKELIFGSPNDAPPEWEWKGRGKEKDFLYEIVANHRNEIDVDKFDYFKRDCYHLGIPVSFDCGRLMRFARIITDEHDGKTQIAYHEKESWNIYELFHTRFNLHKRAYQQTMPVHARSTPPPPRAARADPCG